MTPEKQNVPVCGLAVANKSPQRVQRSRQRGWRMPPNCVTVSRPTKWGNPYDECYFGTALAVELYGRSITGYWTPAGIPENMVAEAYRLHCWLQKVRVSRGLDVAELRGRNLVCWCALTKQCHADVLLRLANTQAQPPKVG